MSVLVVSTEFPPGPGGIGTHAFHVATGLRGRGADVHVLTSQDYVDEPTRLAFNEGLDIAVERLPKRRPSVAQGVAWIRRIRALLRGEAPDVVVASGLRAVWAVWRAVGGRVPWVAVGHGLEFGTPTRWVRALNRRAYAAADAVVTVSAYTQSVLHARGIRPHRDVVIPNGADEQVFTPPPHPRPPNGALILTVGRVCARKGQDLVVEALPRVLEQVGHARYRMVGIPEDAERLRTRAAELGVEGHVEVVGRIPQEEVVRHLHEADLFTMPSRRDARGDFEGFGIACVEAALTGLPSVVTTGSGLVEAVADGETGLAVPPDDAPALAGALSHLLSDGDRRRRMGEAARARALAEQTWSHRVGAYAALLEDVVRNR